MILLLLVTAGEVKYGLVQRKRQYGEARLSLGLHGVTAGARWTVSCHHQLHSLLIIAGFLSRRLPRTEAAPVCSGGGN